MQKTQNNLILLSMLFVVSLVISNVVTAKLVQTNVPLFGATITLPGAVFCYVITFLITDIVGEIWGKQEANKIVIYGFFGQLLATALIILTQYLPVVDPTVQAAYETVLGQSLIFCIASMTAYLLSQTWDVFIFHRLKDKSENKHRWIRNNASTMTSQIIDTAVFIGIGFGIGSGWLSDPDMYPTLAAMLVGQYLFKFCLAILDTPFFYLFTRKSTAE